MKAKFATIKVANEVIKETKENENTCYFGWEMLGRVSYCGMADMIRNFREAGFGVAEANFIVAAMIKAGAKFTI